jgi:hypothetical protein
MASLPVRVTLWRVRSVSVHRPVCYRVCIKQCLHSPFGSPASRTKSNIGEIRCFFVSFQVLTMMSVKMAVLWAVAL